MTRIALMLLAVVANPFTGERRAARTTEWVFTVWNAGNHEASIVMYQDGDGRCWAQGVDRNWVQLAHGSCQAAIDAQQAASDRGDKCIADYQDFIRKVQALSP